MFKKLKQDLRRKKLAKAGVKLDVDIPTVAYGERRATWHVYPRSITRNCIVYSFGVGNNALWDLELIKNHAVELHAFDPTPRSIQWVRSQELPKEFHFHPMGLSNVDGEIEFYVPHRERYVNYSTHNAKKKGKNKVHCPVKRLKTIMQELGHSSIRVLKMDIEGTEMDALPDLLNDGLDIGQILAEFHYMYSSISFESFVQMVALMRSHGYRIFHISDRGYEFSFIHESLL